MHSLAASRAYGHGTQAAAQRENTPAPHDYKPPVQPNAKLFAKISSHQA